MKGSSEILGGYNPIAWKSGGGYSTTKDSFIFSFKNNNNRIENYTLSRVIDEEKSVLNNRFNGPTFGDLKLLNYFSGSSCNSKYYEKPIREIEGQFSVEECEVFRIYKNEV